MSENIKETGPKIIVDDISGVQERELIRVNNDIKAIEDSIANEKAWGGDTSALEMELAQKKESLTPLEDMRDYLGSRDYKDGFDNIHDAASGRFKSATGENDINDYSEPKIQTENLSLDALIQKWAKAEDEGDKTVSGDVQDELQERFIKEPNMSDDIKLSMIDQAYKKMTSYRTNVDNNADTPANYNQPDVNNEKAVQNTAVNEDVNAVEIDTTVFGAEGVNGFCYENENNTVAKDATDATTENKTDAVIDNATQPIAEVANTADKQPGSPLKLVLNVDKSGDAIVLADRMAEARLQKELEAGGKLKHLLNSVWKSGMAKDHYIRKYRIEAMRSIQEHGGDLSDPDAPANVRALAKESQILQFQAEFDEAIHTENGEKKEVLAADHELSIGAKDLVKRYCHGDFLDDNSFAEARTRLINDYHKAHPDEDLGKGIASVNNLLEIAKSVSGMVEHGESIDNVLDNMQIIMGEAHSGARTEAAYNKVDKFIDKLSRTKIGSIIMPLAIVSAVSMAVSIGRFGNNYVTKRGAVLSLGATGGFVFGVAFAGTLAGLKENKRMKDDRSNHMRDTAEGKTFNKNDKRRSELETVSYEIISANKLKEQVDALTQEDVLDNGGEEALKAAIDALATIEARNRYSDTNNVDLISFSNRESIVTERLQLDIARATAKARINSRLTPEMRAQLGQTDFENNNIDQILESQVNNELEVLQIGITEKDKQFNKLKARHVAKAVAIGVATSITIGLASQEIIGIIDPTRAGLVEQAWHAHTTPIGGIEHHTLLGGIFASEQAVTHDGSSVQSIVNNGNGTFNVLDPNGHISAENIPTNPDNSLPQASIDQLQSLGMEVHDNSTSTLIEHTIANNGNGTFDLLDQNGHISADNVPINPDGSLPQASIDQLHGSGFVVTDNSFETSTSSTVTDYVDANEFVERNLDKTVAISSRLYLDGNTPKVFALNELGLWWGDGEHNYSGISADGKYYQMDITHMTAGGSFHDGVSINPKVDDIKLCLTASPDTQGQVFVVDTVHGIANIPVDSPEGQLFSVVDGQAQYDGYMAQASSLRSENADGARELWSLATVMGNNNADSLKVENIVETITKTPIYEIESLVKTPIYEIINTITPDFVEMPPVIPVVPRQNLGSAESHYETAPEEAPSQEISGYQGGYESQPNKTTLDRWTSERSPRLIENPNAKLNPGIELDRYVEDQRSRRGESYIKEIESRIAGDEKLREMNGDTRLVVVMPVAAVQESENIYNTLSLYSQQDETSKSKSVILINVNWKEGATDNPEDKTKIDKTISEINRAKTDFPDLNIASFEKVWSNDWLLTRKDSNGDTAMYGEVIKTLYDTAAFAVKDSMNRGVIDRAQDVLLVTNDADALGMNSNYLKHYIEAEQKNKETDAFIGGIRWGAENIKKYPGYHVSQLYMQTMNMLATRSHKGYSVVPKTIGPNSAFRLSTYAAVGGCEDYRTMGVGADSQLGIKLLAARGIVESSDAGEFGYNSDTDITSGSIVESKKPLDVIRRVQEVYGADIDSSGERLLRKAYLKEQPLPTAWGGFNTGESRDSSSVNGDLANRGEDLVRDFGTIRDRVEKQINYFTNSWYKSDRALTTIALSILFPNSISGGKVDESWSLENTVDEKNRKVLKFKFTKSGAERFKANLSRRQNMNAITKKSFVWPIQKGNIN